MMVSTDDLKPGDGLLVVDVQNDFCPGGALAIPHGDQVVPVLNTWLAAAGARDLPVYASRDWHPRRHPSFRDQGGEWPPHCLQDTDGAAFHFGLQLPADTVVVTKGVRFDKDQYSAFHETGLLAQLQRDGVRRLFVGGLAQDVCVRDTVLAAREAGLDVVLLQTATRPVDADEGRRALDDMGNAGAVMVSG